MVANLSASFIARGMKWPNRNEFEFLLVVGGERRSSERILRTKKYSGKPRITRDDALVQRMRNEMKWGILLKSIDEHKAKKRKLRSPYIGHNTSSIST